MSNHYYVDARARDIERIRSAFEQVASTIALTVRAEIEWLNEGCCIQAVITYVGDSGAFHRDTWWELLSRLRDELERLGFSLKSMDDVVDDAGRVRMELLFGVIQPE